MTTREKELLEIIKNLQRQLSDLQSQNKALLDQVTGLTEMVSYFKQEFFGVSSEKNRSGKSKDLTENPDFFDESEETEGKTVESGEVLRPERRKKEKGRKARLMEKFEEKEIELTLDGEACSCPVCLSQMKAIGKKEVRSELVFRPATLYRVKYVSHTYACDCHEVSTEPAVIFNAPAPKSPLPGSLAGPTVIARAIYMKHVLSVPAYRQIQEWALYGLQVNRNTLVNWINRPSLNWLGLVYDLLHMELMGRSVLHGDETPYQVLKRPDGKPSSSEARFWLARTTPGEINPIIYYHADLTKSGEVAEKLYKGFRGYLHCDGYQVYYSLEGVTVVACWAHVRRKFREVASPTGKGYAAEAFGYCNKIFGMEKEIQDLPPEMRLEKRQNEIKPVIEAFFKWLERIPTIKGKFEEAVNYAKNHKDALMVFLTDGRLQAHNNAAEERIRVIAIGRKNYLFSDTLDGARANARALTIIETAKANGLDPYKYMVWLLEELPNLEIGLNPDLLRKFLPWTQEAGEHCGKL